jgi:hypothetical protein
MLCYWNVNKAQFYFYLVSILGNLSDLIFVCEVSNQSIMMVSWEILHTNVISYLCGFIEK